METTLEDIKKLAAQINAIDDLPCLISISLSTYSPIKKSVHMDCESFKEIFTKYSRKRISIDNYELFADVDGVHFFCLEKIILYDTVEEINNTEPEE